MTFSNGSSINKSKIVKKHLDNRGEKDVKP